MADVKNRQILVDVEYCLDKYFQENFAPIVARTSKELREKQVAESAAIQRQYAGGGKPNTGSGGLPVMSMVGHQQAQKAEWNSKKTEDLIDICNSECNKKLLADKSFVHDYQILVLSYRSALVGSIGEKRYAALSKQSESGDLATDYVNNRFQQLILEQLAKQQMPQSSLEYILGKGVGGSWVGMVSTLGITLHQSEKDKELETLAEKLYNPSTGEKLTSGAVSFLVDYAATGGLGNAGWIGKTLLGVDAASQLALPFVPDKEATFDQAFSSEVFGSPDTLNRLRASSQQANPSRSKYINVINQNLNKKLKISTYQPLIDKKVVQQFTERLKSSSKGDANVLFQQICTLYERMGIPYQDNPVIPQWMENKDAASLRQSAAYFTSLAVEMKEKNKSSVYVGKTPMSAQQVSQRGYDYARAAVKKQEAKRSERQTEVPYSEVQQQGELETPLQQDTQTTTPISPAAQTGLNGWEGLLNHLGLGGFGDIGKNLGYVLAMLPDMLISLLTGKNSSFKLENNLLPLAAIFGGMFVRNPMMKMLLIGLGGANLLNKVGHEALKGVGIPHQHPTKDYKRYADEPLNQRLQDPAMKGNTLVVQIDGVPQVVTIQSDTVLDAYHKGALPLNVLSNAVLRQYDIQREPLAPHYVPLMQEEEVQGKKMVIK